MRISDWSSDVCSSDLLGDPGTAAFQLEKYPFYLLNRLVSRYNVVIEARLKTIGIDIPYWRVLLVLGQKSTRGVGQLDEAAVIPFSTITCTVKRMVTAQLVVCRQLDGGKRVTRVQWKGGGEGRREAVRVGPRGWREYHTTH